MPAVKAVRQALSILLPHRSNRHAEPEGPIRLTVVQYGDYADAAARFKAGGEENYYAQRYTVDFVAELAHRADIGQVTVITCSTDQSPMMTDTGVWTAGVELHPPGRPPRPGELVAAVSETRPTHLVVASPIIPAIEWGLRRNLPVLPLFADSFHARGLKAYIRNHLLARLLNHPAIEVVANHGLAASLDLARIGVRRDKIVPFDWPELVSVYDYAPKLAPPQDRPFRMIYVGYLSEEKGAGDAVRALSILRRGGYDMTLTLVGGGDSAPFEDQARQEGVAEHVAFTGRIPHSRVLAEMSAHHVVLVPSHHSYPEGLPMTIYEALCVRVPLVTSDHPMFALRVRDGIEALVHPARDTTALADRVQRLATDSKLYEDFSVRSDSSVKNYLCPLKWDRLLEGFLHPTTRTKLLHYSLARYSYN